MPSQIEPEVTPHSYGWTPSPPDIRDRIFAAPPHIVAALPTKVDLTDPRLPAPFEPSWDQKSIGSCGAFSSGADIVFAALRQQNLPATSMPSCLFIYYIARSLMGTVNSDSGVNNRAMLKALAKYGWCDESLWPYIPAQYRAKPPAEAFAQAATRRIAMYESVPQDLPTMKAVIAGGDCFIFGFSVYASMETAEVQRTGEIPMPSARDQFMGGHDVVLCGYSDETRRFKLKNSWGGWGQAGYGTIPYEYALNDKLAGDFWTIKHAALPLPPGPPDPPPPPIDPTPPIDIFGLFDVRSPSQLGGLISIHLKDGNASIKELLKSLKEKS